MRTTTDIVEQIGIQRALEQLGKSNIALWVIDPTMESEAMDSTAAKLLSQCRGKRLAVLVNKCDVTDPVTLSRTMQWATKMIEKYGDGVEWDSADMWAISAKLGTNMDMLHDFLQTSAALPELSDDAVVVTNIRHYEALRAALDDIRRVQQAMHDGLPGDLVSEDLRLCINHLSEIVGSVSSDLVLQNIFKNFCIGK